MWLKVLIAIACAAVIGFVGFAGWDRYAAYQRKQALAKFESFCDLQFETADYATAQGRQPASHVVDGMTRCEAAGYVNDR